MKSYLKANWRQLLTLATSLGVAAALHFHKITPDEAILVGTLCATYGINLLPIGWGSRASVEAAAKEIVAAPITVIETKENP